jgi:hypothetical protein
MDENLARAFESIDLQQMSWGGVEPRQDQAKLNFRLSLQIRRVMVDLIGATTVKSTVVVTELNKNNLCLNSVAQTGGDTCEVGLSRLIFVLI